MEIIDAFWEQRNLGISCSEITADTGDTVKGMLEALALLTSQYQVIKLPVSRYDLMRVVEQHGFSFIEGSMNVVHNLKNIDRSGIQKRLNDSVCYEEMDEFDISRLYAELQHNDMSIGWKMRFPVVLSFTKLVSKISRWAFLFLKKHAREGAIRF